MSERVDVIVLGGGISGLAAAHSALNAGASVILLDAGDECGGVMRTEAVDGFLVEHGPTSMASTEHTLALMNAIGLAPDILAPAPTAKRRYVVRNGAMHALPGSPPALLRSRLLSARGKLRLLAEPFIRRTRSDSDESLAMFVQRRFGREVLDYLVDPFVSGTCAGDATRLSKRFTLRILDELERSHGSVILGAIKRARSGASNASSHIVSLRHGMQQLPDALCQSIDDIDKGALRAGARITAATRSSAGWTVHYTERGQHELAEASTIVSALPAHALAQVSWPDQWADLLSQLSAVRYAPIATVALGFERSHVQHSLDGFGVLFPSVEGRRILGALFNSSLFAGRAPTGHCLLTAFVGGARTSAAPSEREAIDSALRELTPLLGITGAPVMTHVARWQRGIPQLEMGHDNIRIAARGIEECTPDALFTGSYLSGVSIGDCLAHGSSVGRRAAAEALRDRSSRHGIFAGIPR